VKLRIKQILISVCRVGHFPHICEILWPAKTCPSSHHWIQYPNQYLAPALPLCLGWNKILATALHYQNLRPHDLLVECQITCNSATDGSVLFKCGVKFEHAMRDALQKFKINRLQN